MSRTYHLPWPISVNSLWRAYKGRNILSRRARLWAEIAEKQLALQEPQPIKGSVQLTIQLSPPTKRAYDLDNRCKSLIDLLVACGVIEADDAGTLKRLVVEASTLDPPGAYVTVEAI